MTFEIPALGLSLGDFLQLHMIQEHYFEIKQSEKKVHKIKNNRTKFYKNRENRIKYCNTQELCNNSLQGKKRFSLFKENFSLPFFLSKPHICRLTVQLTVAHQILIPAITKPHKMLTYHLQQMETCNQFQLVVVDSQDL